MPKRKVEVVVTIESEAERIISAFMEFEILRDWWNVERSLVEKRLGGNYILLWGIKEKGIEFVSTGIIDAYDPKEILRIKNFAYICSDRPVFGDMILEIRLEEQHGKSKVHLKQTGYKDGKHWDWYHNTVSKVWPQTLNALREYLENQN